MYLAGVEMRDIMFWVPQNGTIGMGISILSYNEQVFFGLMADRRLDAATPTKSLSSSSRNLKSCCTWA